MRNFETFFACIKIAICKILAQIVMLQLTDLLDPSGKLRIEFNTF